MRYLLTILLLACLSGAPDALAQNATSLIVGPNESITRITDAINQATPGDRIVIREGIYQEGPIVVDKRLELVGEGDAVLDGEDEHEVLLITADSVLIEGLTIRNVGSSYTRDRAGIRVDRAHHAIIRDNRLENTFFGISLARSHHTQVLHNEVIGIARREANSGNGIHLWDTNYAEVTGNTVRGHRDGIYIEFGEGSSFTDNLAENNLRYGLHFMFSDNSQYTGNTFRDNGAGAAVMYSRNITMRGNEFSHNWGVSIYGLLLKDINDSVIEGNRFFRNTTAIYSEGMTRTTVQGNDFERNGWGVRVLSNSYDNTFTRNNFVGNSFDVTTNSRRNPNTFIENYWARYSGYDLTGDGIGDVPHRPVRLFAIMVEQQPAALSLMGSLFVDLLDLTERVLPVLTPETLVDERPLMTEIR